MPVSRNIIAYWAIVLGILMQNKLRVGARIYTILILIFVSPYSAWGQVRTAINELSFLQASDTVNPEVAAQSARVDTLMTPWSKGDSPGAAVLVVQNGGVLLKKGYGLSNIESGEAISPKTIFDLASVSKQFTAMAIMILIERGRLNLDDPLAKFFPEFPSYARGITIRNLLNLTSGIPDYPKLLIESGKIAENWQRGWEPTSFKPTSKDVLALLAEHKTLDFKPGEQWAYSNSNYVILAGIIERVSGKSFTQFLKDQIFQPLGMKDTFVFDQRQMVKSRASRYDRAATGYKVITSTPFDLIYGDGNIHSTIDDLNKWDQALYKEKLVKSSILKQALTSGRLNNGATTNYGFGWVLDNYFGLSIVYHQGGGTGFNTFIMRIPEQRFTVIVLSNFARFNPFIVGRKIARLYLADKLSLPVAVKVSPEVLKKYVGRYRFTPLIEVVITLEGDVLRAESPVHQRMTLLPLSETKFFVEGEEDTIVTFQSDTSGNVDGVTILQVDISTNGKKLDSSRQTQPVPEIKETESYDSYIGDYELRPGVVITLRKEGDRLMAEFNGRKFELSHVRDSLFSVTQTDIQIEFVKTDHGNITHLIFRGNGREGLARKIGQ